MNEVPEQTRTTGRTSLYAIPNNKCGVRTNQNKGQKHVIIIARTRYYYIQNKFVCHLEKKMSEQIRITVRTKSYCSWNNFVCHLEQKQMYCQNKLEQGSEQVVIIARTRYL
jgi:hypothetical protein